MYEGSTEMSADVRDWGGLSVWLCFSVLRITIQSTNTIYTTLFNASSNKSYTNKPTNYWQLLFMICKTHFLYEKQWPGATLKLRCSTAPFIANLCTRWRRVVSFSPRPVYSRERHQELNGERAWLDASIGLDMLWKGIISCCCGQYKPNCLVTDMIYVFNTTSCLK